MLRIYLYLTFGWLVISTIGILGRKRRVGKLLLKASYVGFLLLFIEAVSVLGFYVKTRRWTFQEQDNFARTMFEARPYMIGAGKPSAQITRNGIRYTHNSAGFRGKDFPTKSQKIRIVTIGGSTTYGVGVSDDDTWPAQLERQLGNNYEVLNLGVLGHSTAEHIAMLSLTLPEYHPDILIMHVGLNDLRNLHVKNLKSDYSNYHAPILFNSYGFCSASPFDRFASGKLAIWTLQEIHVLRPCAFSGLEPEEDSSHDAEEMAKSIYRRNLETLMAIAKSQGLKPILVPQILVKERFQGGRLKWWIPFIEDDQLIGYLNVYNALTEEVAKKEGLIFVRGILEQMWTASDFVDPSHLSPDGNRKFAAILQRAVSNMKEQDYRTVADKPNSLSSQMR
jgi:lysophospholipase L1-like esterase